MVRKFVRPWVRDGVREVSPCMVIHISHDQTLPIAPDTSQESQNTMQCARTPGLRSIHTYRVIHSHLFFIAARASPDACETPSTWVTRARMAPRGLQSAHDPHRSHGLALEPPRRLCARQSPHSSGTGTSGHTSLARGIHMHISQQETRTHLHTPSRNDAPRRTATPRARSSRP